MAKQQSRQSASRQEPQTAASASRGRQRHGGRGNSFAAEQLQKKAGRAPSEEQAEGLSEAFGHDLSGLRIHDGADAADAADDMNASAFAQGSDVFLGQGVSADANDPTFMHEVAHVVQAERGEVGAGGDGPSSPGDAVEGRADAMASSAKAPSPAGTGPSVASQSAAAPIRAAGPVLREGEDVVASYQTDLTSPYDFQDVSASPSDIATYDDASLHADSVFRFLLRVLQDMDPTDPRYGTAMDVVDLFDGLSSEWAGNLDPFAGEGRLGPAIQSAVNFSSDFAGDVSQCDLVLDWNFPNLRVNRSGRTDMFNRGQRRSFASTVVGILTPYRAPVEANPESPWYSTLPAIVDEWAAVVEANQADPSQFCVLSEHQALESGLVARTTALLADMNARPIRTVNLAMGEPFRMDGTSFDVTTYAAASEFVRDVSSELFFRDSDLFPSDDEEEHRMKAGYATQRDIWDELSTHISDAGVAAGWQESITADDFAEIEIAALELTAYLREMNAAFDADLREARRGLAQANRDAEAAHRTFLDLQRTAFLSGATAELPVLLTMAGHSTTLLAELATAQQALSGWAGGNPSGLLRTSIPAVLSNSLTVATVFLTWSSESPLTRGSGLDGLAALNNAVSIAGAVNSFVVNPLYIVTAYVGPMLSAITVMLGQLQQRLIEQNDVWVELGYDPLYLGAEPGGAPMWDYMKEVMWATSARGVPAPTGGVYDYFEEFRDNFDAIGEGESVPTDGGFLGTGIDEDVDADAFKAWIFGHRDTVWASLYGSRPVPERRR